MSKHSPGPWVENPVGSGILRRCQVEDRDGNIVAEVSNMNEDSALIAAAPEMLEALETVMDEVGKDYLACRSKVEAAIAKAKGGSK